MNEYEKKVIDVARKINGEDGHDYIVPLIEAVEALETDERTRAAVPNEPRPVTVDDAIRVLNEAVAADQDAISHLVNDRVACGQELADHPTIQVAVHGPADHSVGLLGILNGIFGADADGWGFITAGSEDDGTVIQFMRTPPRKAKT